ncbi:membrane protein [Paenibacillus albidus]|uniref:Membrane protein n=1 Tax=Paenibacillus albidus TaxID=2041023 RepID=A0A917C538_9BACL|nr:putative ABC transporter permease [Paenibacillus albidus]GGF71153.1 membrane protein [Paenibacillus albidus]
MFVQVGTMERLAPGATAGQLFFYFIMYSFLGWVLEGSYNLYSKGSFRKEGFLKGPFKPMYGCAPLLMLLAGELAPPWWLFLLLGLLVPTGVEFASGWLLQRLFHKQWWDYSGLRCQWQGHICLRFSLYWWILIMACVFTIQPLMVLLYRQIQFLWGYMLPGAAVLFAADLLWTCRTRLRGREEKDLELGQGKL